MDGRHEDVSFIAKVRITKKGGMTNDHNPYTVPSFGTFGTCLVWAYTVILTGFTELERPKMVAIIKKIIKGLSSSALAVSKSLRRME